VVVLIIRFCLRPGAKTFITCTAGNTVEYSAQLAARVSKQVDAKLIGLRNGQKLHSSEYFRIRHVECRGVVRLFSCIY